MDRTFAEVRAAFAAWAQADARGEAPAGGEQAAHAATREAARRMADLALGEARAWAHGAIGDAELHRRLSALARRLAAAAWLQGGAAERERGGAP